MFFIVPACEPATPSTKRIQLKPISIFSDFFLKRYNTNQSGKITINDKLSAVLNNR